MSNPPRPQDGAASAWRWAIPALLLLVPAFGWPLFVLGTFALDAGAVTEVVREPAIWQRLGVSTGQALLSTALSLALGLPVAWMLSQFRFPGHAAVRLLVLLPVVLPTIVVALAVQQLLGPAGWLNAALDRLDRVPVQAVGTLWAILAAHAIFGVAIVAWVVTGAWARLDRRQVEAARMLGAT
ncbi:MAG: iron ABC transporter permease, partial [Dehalococcoidia bacterium]